MCHKELSRITKNTTITSREYYSQYDYLELSSTKNTIDNLIDIGNDRYVLNTKTNNGKDIRLLIIGKINTMDNGWGSITSDTQIFSLDALPGINFIDYEFANVISYSSMYFGLYYNLYQQESVESYDDLQLLYYEHLFQSKASKELSMYPDYFNLRNFYNDATEIVSMKIYFCDVFSEIIDIEFYLDFY